MDLALSEDQKTSLDNFGFQLTEGNANNSENNYPTIPQTLQSGATSNSTTCVNIGGNLLEPLTRYDNKTQTVTSPSSQFARNIKV